MLSLYVYYMLFLTIKACPVNVLIPLWSKSSGSWSFRNIMSCCLPAQSWFRLVLELPERLFWFLQASGGQPSLWVIGTVISFLPCYQDSFLLPPHICGKKVRALLVSGLK